MSKKEGLVITALLLALLIIPNTLAASNESTQAKLLLGNATSAIEYMQSRNISVVRVNETFQKAVQLFDAQLALETRGGQADYKIINSYVDDIISIKENSIKAQDELKIFLESYNSVAKEVNLSEMDEEYNEVLRAYKEERFEDVAAAINEAYQSLSEAQSSQTRVKLFYEATSKNIKTFLKNNWLKILIISAIIVISLIISWKTIKRIRINRELQHLQIQRETLNNLIKQIQRDYFEKKTISETEYFSKTEKFKDMLLEIDRQVPMLKESLLRLSTEQIKSSKEKNIQKKENKSKPWFSQIFKSKKVKIQTKSRKKQNNKPKKRTKTKRKKK